MNNCIFCRIIARESPARIIYEDDQLVVFHDIQPQAPVHLLIVPKKHLARIQDMRSEDNELLGHLIFTARQIAEKQGLNQNGYRLVINNGRHGGQAVFHLHLHLLGGRPMHWPPG
jgi:histidine triad (HIT) family protein